MKSVKLVFDGSNDKTKTLKFASFKIKLILYLIYTSCMEYLNIFYRIYQRERKKK